MIAAVDEVGRVAAAEGVDARFHKGGMMTMAVSQAQLERARQEVEYERSWGAEEGDCVVLGADEARARIDAPGCLGALYSPHCACIDPARLTRGLADAVEQLGVTIYEQTQVLAITPHYVHSLEGLVKAEVVVRATEAFTTNLPGCHREYVPVYSLMIATEPLPQSFWDQVGWAGYETFTDGRNLIIYVMRTEDGRIALGGRGAPYHFGSLMRDEFDRDPHVFEKLRASLAGLFPQLGDARITHHWGGPIAMPRDWWSSVGLDRQTGMAWAGGYLGDGVSTTNLAGRTLADLITAADSDIVKLPWVNHRNRKWEPEPLRWLGVNATIAAMGMADAEERRTGRQSRIMAITHKIIGQ
jgi:glycine/D-amino acid oxidase-like deaminating enzyme